MEDQIIKLPKIKYDKSCMESYPCQHRVKIDGISLGIMDGAEICEVYRKYGLTPPNHFLGYENVEKN